MTEPKSHYSSAVVLSATGAPLYKKPVLLSILQGDVSKALYIQQGS